MNRVNSQKRNTFIYFYLFIFIYIYLYIFIYIYVFFLLLYIYIYIYFIFIFISNVIGCRASLTEKVGRVVSCRSPISITATRHDLSPTCPPTRLDMGVAEFKSARRWKNKSHSPPRRSSSESNLVFQSEVT